ncbi:amidase [Artemisia annua]|uniref:Amidase n=1 Tax=Artemisia annua TaxID=35608 RepID=A0A2U1LL91_ARTAN|nr:amidase [Artemisia annua]
MATVSLGKETDGSILCPSIATSLIGMKPTVGITSRSGVIPVTPRQDQLVTIVVYVLDAIVGFDIYDEHSIKNLQNWLIKITSYTNNTVCKLFRGSCYWVMGDILEPMFRLGMIKMAVLMVLLLEV